MLDFVFVMFLFLCVQDGVSLVYAAIRHTALRLSDIIPD